MSSELRDSEEARKRTKGLVGAAGIFAAVAVIVLAAVLLAPMIQSETGDQSSDDGGVTVIYRIGGFGNLNESYNTSSDPDSSITVRYQGCLSPNTIPSSGKDLSSERSRMSSDPLVGRSRIGTRSTNILILGGKQPVV